MRKVLRKPAHHVPSATGGRSRPGTTQFVQSRDQVALECEPTPGSRWARPPPPALTS
jgi:hypothetical protein